MNERVYITAIGRAASEIENVARRGLVAAHVARGELQEGRPIRGVGVAALVLSECQVTRNQGCSNRHVRSAESFLAQKLVNGSCGDLGHELAFVVNPTTLYLRRAATDEHRTQRRKCDQFVGIHGQIVRGERARVSENSLPSSDIRWWRPDFQPFRRSCAAGFSRLRLRTIRSARSQSAGRKPW